jgi:hypothetical protein
MLPGSPTTDFGEIFTLLLPTSKSYSNHENRYFIMAEKVRKNNEWLCECVCVCLCKEAILPRLISV